MADHDGTQVDAPAELPAGFEAALFGRASPEDLSQYRAEQLARFAASAYAHLGKARAGGSPDIRLPPLTIEIGGRARDLTIIEVVNDNMPFLLDSTLAELTEQGYEPRFVVHPILAVERDAKGRLIRFAGDALASAPQAGTRRESLIQIHIDRIDEAQAQARLVDGLDKVYRAVRAATQGWAAMRGRLAEAVQAYQSHPPPLPPEEVAEAVVFLQWLASDNFTLLGMREYRFPDGDAAADPVEGSGLGILADPGVKVLRRGKVLMTMTPEIRAFLTEPAPLIVTKANVKSLVHRRVHMDYVGVKLFTPDGRLSGELRVVGLFTSNAYTGSTASIPLIRHKVAQVARRAGFDPASHSGRALMNVLESYPRDELFQLDVETLLRFSTDILTLYERPRVRALARVERFDRFVSVIVYIPKDHYDTGVRQRVGAFLARLYHGRLSAAYPAYPEGPLARTHYIIGRDEGATPRVDRQALEAGIAAIARTWGDALKDALSDAMDGPRARLFSARYRDAFSAAYREAFSAGQAIADIAVIERLTAETPRFARLERRDGDDAARVNLKVFSRGRGAALTERVPVLEAMGFKVVNERTYRVIPDGAPRDAHVWLHDMSLERRGGGPVDLDRVKPQIEAALMALIRGQTESDGYNALILEAGLGWRDVAMLRALSRYLQQIRVPFSQDYMAATLAKHPGIASEIVALFHARFDPRPAAENDRAGKQAVIRAKIEDALTAIASLDEDRILRRFVNLVEAAIRTSFFQLGRDGAPRDVIAMKYASGRIEGLPKPSPLVEIHLLSPRVEGVHLRFGKVARGGLRWSDRPMDFRTEILGLVKAQQVKNAVIVPVGAKGGFVPKQLPPPADREAFMAEGVAAYREFVGALLDLTDNVVDGAVVAPALTVRHDGDDPYLVVAADKGTAAFSDIANAISLAHGHWLGDAFASGGSQGYDHKKMGITARGAWVAVQRHFRELDLDIQSTPFTVAGVGDMSGDVFGNGMLLSPCIRLVAAFDHRDIFLDPDPDPAVSFAERRRLFDLPRSSWADYDRSVISAGGGVFSRHAKSIALTPQIQAVLGLDRPSVTPAEVMQAILRAEVDLLWFGGIGAYIRASAESDDQVGDRANDAIRITGAQVRAKVIGEGANLGCTQLGRIEAARRGVRLNTDAIDNSAGVNTSDLEVNIKIALFPAERAGALGEPRRAALLADMTDEVAALVLRNNDLQTLALSLAELAGKNDLGYARRLMQTLEAEGRLDRLIEYLPDEAELAAREGRGEALTRPEYAVLLAYAKLSLHDRLLASGAPDDVYLTRELTRYFPKRIAESYPEAIESHPLRREIIATQLANAIVNRCGPTAVTRLTDQTGADAATIARAYAAARDSFTLGELNTAIDRLNGHMRGLAQNRLYAIVQSVLLSRLVWFLRHIDWSAEALDAVVDRFRAGISQTENALDAALGPAEAAAIETQTASLAAQGAPRDLAARLARLPYLAAATDVTMIAWRSGRPVPEVAASHAAVASRFKIVALTQAAGAIALADYYDRLARERALETIAGAHRGLTMQALAEGGSGADSVDALIAARQPGIGRTLDAIETITASGLTPSKLTVAANLLADLAKA